MTVIFDWSEAEMQSLLSSCDRDEAWPILARHFPAGSRLLESGCGSARWVRFLTDRGRDVVGLEFNAAAVAMVNRVWPDLDVRAGDCTQSPFPASSFDGVLSFGVVEHWQDGPQKPLRDIVRVLKPGGKALISVPCHNRIRQIKRVLWWNEITQAPRALAKALLRRYPLRLLRTDAGNHYPAYPAWGKFYEYRMHPEAFRSEVQKCGLEIVEHVPLGHMDGVYHELNPCGLLVGFKDWQFRPSALARWIDTRLLRTPFAHCHMQAIVAVKPLGSGSL